MSSHNFINKKHKGTIDLIIDVGSGSIAVALVEHTGAVPKIVYSLRKQTPFQKKIDYTRFVDDTHKTLTEVIESLQKNGLTNKKIDDIYCFFASPWYVSQTRILKFASKDPQNITKQFIEKFTVKGEKEFRESKENADEMKEEHIAPDSPLIEKHAIFTKLNGYHTSNPHGKKARTVEIFLFLSIVSKDIHKRIKETILKTFNNKSVIFHSFALTAFSALRDIYYGEEDFIFMDISSEVTDISVIREGALIETLSFPYGKRTAIRNLSQLLKTEPPEAASKMALYLEKSLNDKEKESFKKTLLRVEEEWLKALQSGFAELSEDISLPNVIFFSADEDMGKWFGSIIKKDTFGQYSLTTEPFTVIELNKKRLNEFVTISENARLDPFIALEAVFVDKANNI